jgi:hypothetical protein
MIAESTITCPHCGHQATETMPTDALAYFAVDRMLMAFSPRQN